MYYVWPEEIARTQALIDGEAALELVMDDPTLANISYAKKARSKLRAIRQEKWDWGDRILIGALALLLGYLSLLVFASIMGARTLSDLRVIWRIWFVAAALVIAALSYLLIRAIIEGYYHKKNSEINDLVDNLNQAIEEAGGQSRSGSCSLDELQGILDSYL